MAKRKLKKKVKKILFISIVALILLIVGIKVINNYKYNKHMNINSYKKNIH